MIQAGRTSNLPDTQAYLHALLADVRTAAELLPALQACLGHDGAAVSLVNEQVHTQYLHFLAQPQKKDATILEKLQQECAQTDGLLAPLLATQRARLFILDQPRLPLFLQGWQQMGMRQARAIALRSQGKAFGILWIFSKEINNVEALPLELVAFPVAALLKALQAQEMLARRDAENLRCRQQLQEQRLYLQEQLQAAASYGELVGNSVAMQQVYGKVAMVAQAASTVLLVGETGTGKELIARAIHQASGRHEQLMIKVNCAAMPEHLIESELFGHEKGSFTGAVDQRIGKFELANNSTILLDEIGEMPLALQSKLLRVIQEREIERIGGNQPIKTDVRIIAATNRDLEKEVNSGRFRSDLFYRLHVFPIQLPPLRERKDDIPLLARHFLQKIAQAAGRPVKTLSPAALKELQRYSWPGNVRELEHIMERSTLLAEGDVITHVDLPENERQLKGARAAEPAGVKTIAEAERDHIIAVLEKCKGRIRGENGAAALLKIPPTTLHSKIKKLGIKKGHG